MQVLPRSSKEAVKGILALAGHRRSRDQRSESSAGTSSGDCRQLRKHHAPMKSTDIDAAEILTNLKSHPMGRLASCPVTPSRGASTASRGAGASQGVGSSRVAESSREPSSSRAADFSSAAGSSRRYLSAHSRLQSSAKSSSCPSCNRPISAFFGVVLNMHCPDCKEICRSSQPDSPSPRPVPGQKTARASNPAKKKFCEICHMGFAQRSGLNSHISTVHKGERKYKCPIHGCTAAFGHRGDVTRHVSSAHDKKKPYVCDICGEKLTRNHSLSRHKKTVHKM